MVVVVVVAVCVFCTTAHALTPCSCLSVLPAVTPPGFKTTVGVDGNGTTEPCSDGQFRCVAWQATRQRAPQVRHSLLVLNWRTRSCSALRPAVPTPTGLNGRWQQLQPAVMSVAKASSRPPRTSSSRSTSQLMQRAPTRRSARAPTAAVSASPAAAADQACLKARPCVPAAL